MMSADCPLPEPTPAGPVNRLRSRAVVGGFLLLFLAGLVGLAATTGWQETRAQLARLHLWQIGLLLLLSLGNYLLRGLRWHLFTRCLGLPTSAGTDLCNYFGGFAMSVTPGKIGELVRIRWLSRETGWALDRVAPLALIDRAADLAAMALMLGGCIALATTAIRGAVPVAVLAFATAVIATRPALLAGTVTLAYRMTGRLPRLCARLRRAALSFDVFGKSGVVLPALALGLLGWALEGFAFYLLVGWLGADIGLAKAVAIFLFATLAGGLTGAPGGVGGAEAAMIALLALDGVPLNVALAATAIIRVTTLWFAVGIGMLAFPIAERLSVKGVK